MKFRYSILLFFVVVTGLFACKNNDSVVTPTVSTALGVINASGDTLNYYINGTRQNNLASITPGGSLIYTVAPAGQQTYQFKKAGIGNANVLFSLPLNLKDSSDYSLFVSGESADKAFAVLDQSDTSAVNFCTVRFVSAAADAGSVDVTVGDTVKYTAQAFKSASSFLQVGVGPKKIRIYQSGTTNLLKDTTLTLQQKTAYTLFTRGVPKSATGPTVGVSILINFQ